MNKEYNILTDYLCNYIYPNKKYTGPYQMRVASNNTLKIKYNKHYYIISIVEENNQLFWKMKPYRNSYFTTIIDEYSSFDRVLFAIKEHDEIKYK